jgi:hypothetical protein
MQANLLNSRLRVKRIFYALRFNGKVRAAAGEPGRLRTTCTATSCVQSTLMGPDGFSTNVKPRAGDLVFLESVLRLTGPGYFEENGTITFGCGDKHELRFSTRSAGRLAPGPDQGSIAGMVRWEIEGGPGTVRGCCRLHLFQFHPEQLRSAGRVS